MAIGSGRMSRAGMLQQLRVLARGSFGIPLLLLTVLAMMTLPIPPLLLDALFSFNIALSLVVLLVAVYALRPLDFAVFPTILLVTTLLRLALWCTGLSGGLYWCARKDFHAVGGFDEGRPFGEDVDFAKRLRAHGRRSGRRFTTLRRAWIVTSCRKFDRFGDWHWFKFLLQTRAIQRSLRGESTEFQDRYFYEFNAAVKPDAARGPDERGH